MHGALFRGLDAILTDEGHRRLREARHTHLADVRRLFLDRFDPSELERLASCWQRVEPSAVVP